MTSKRLSVFLACILLFATMSSCSEQASAPQKDRIYIQRVDYMSDDPKLDVSKLGYAEYLEEETEHSFPEEKLLNTPWGEVSVTKQSTEGNENNISKLGICEYSAINGEIYRVDSKGRITHFDCSQRAYSSDKDQFFNQETITAEQAVEKAKELVAAFAGDYVLKYLQPHLSETPSAETELYVITFLPPNTEGYSWKVSASIFLSRCGSLITMNNLASDVRVYENVPEGFSEMVDSLVGEWMKDSGVEYTYTKGKIQLLNDGRLAATGVIYPVSGETKYQPVTVAIPLE